MEMTQTNRQRRHFRHMVIKILPIRFFSTAFSSRYSETGLPVGDFWVTLQLSEDLTGLVLQWNLARKQKICDP